MGSAVLLVSEHTDWKQHREFQSLSTEDKLLQIWLNGKETNGKVADAMRDIAAGKEQMEAYGKRLSTVERWIIGVTAVATFVLIAAPFVFWGLDRLAP